MNTTIDFGHWIDPTPRTGDSSMLVKSCEWLSVTLTTALTAFRTGSTLDVEHLHEKISDPNAVFVNGVDEFVTCRTPAEDLARIREVLSPAVSDLANMFGVTRQSVYNWLNGEPVAPENAAKLRDLAEAADSLAHQRVAINSTLLKRKFANGKTLFQVVQAGESSRDAVAVLLDILQRESKQRERMNARLINRATTPATADFDLPASNGNA